MPFRTIAVFLDQTPASEIRAEYAVRLSLRHQAHLIGLFIAPTGWTGDPLESTVRGPEAIRQLIRRHETQEATASASTEQHFKAITRHENISFEFRVIRQANVDDEILLHSLHADLAIVGHPQPGGLPSDWSADMLLLATGVPFLMLPDRWDRAALADHVLLPWNASREARRAITDSLPLLIAAQSVTILIVDPQENIRHGEEPGADIALYLSRHGVNVELQRLLSEKRPVADVILNYAEQNNISMIVLGAYSHARAKEIIFGGVTRSMIKNTTIPLLIAH